MTFEEYMEGIDRSVMEYLPDFIPSEAVRIVLDEQGDRPIFGLKIMLPQMEENDLNQLEIITDLQGCYKEVKDLSLEHAVKETAVLITEILKRQKLSRIKAMVRTALDFEIAKEHLYMDLCNVGKRPDWLEECVCKKIPGAEDLALVASVRLTLPDGDEGSFKVRKNELEIWGVSAETAVEMACKNGLKRYGIRLQTMDKGLPDLLEIPMGDKYQELQEVIRRNPFMVTGREFFCGAASRFYPGMMEKLGETIGDYSFLVVSSNYIFVVPDGYGERKGREGILQAEKLLSSKYSFLSENVYCYDTKKERLLLAADCIERKQEEPQPKKNMKKQPHQERKYPHL